MDIGAKPFVKYMTVWGRVGAKVLILGEHFTNDSVVTFNGVTAQKLTVHPNYVTVVVPEGATTGPITVSTDTGLLKSNKDFLVH